MKTIDLLKEKYGNKISENNIQDVVFCLIVHTQGYTCGIFSDINDDAEWVLEAEVGKSLPRKMKQFPHTWDGLQELCHWVDREME